MQSRVPRGFVLPKFRVAVALCAAMYAAACGGDPTQQRTGALLSDAGTVIGPDGAVIPLINQVTLHIVGLTGSGLTVRLGQSEDYTASADGIYKVPLQTAVTDVNPLVLVQPDAPAQTCDFAELDDAVYALTCAARKYHVGGNVVGLAGTGLSVVSQSGETLALDASGAFQFTEELEDDTPYSVTLMGEVDSPHQTCMLSNGTGKIHDGDTTDVTVTCSTNSYYITTNVEGLVETGLKIKVTDGSIIPVPLAGTFKYDTPYPDGYTYSLDIAQQPDGNQRCVVNNGHNTIDGADVTIDIICDALGGLRISEVGSCPFSSSSCWFEIFNANPDKLTEQLGFYKIRTTAIGPKAFESSHIFSLPQIEIPYKGVVVVQAATLSALPDGNNVVHLADGNVVPWWTGDGFVELLRGDNITTDFVSFGKSTAQPMVGGTWLVDDSGYGVQGLPTGASSYGWSIQHVPKLIAISSPDNWSAHAFSTYGGLNDVTSDVDADADGIPDANEVQGKTFCGIDVYSMGARPAQKDVFVEIDHMDSTDPAVLPRKEALDKLVAVYKGRNITMHFDVGTLYSAKFDPSNYNLGGGNTTPFSKGIALGSNTSGLANLYAIKALNMVAPRRGFFYYQLFSWSQQSDGSPGSSGVGELPGNDSVVTLGGFNLSTANAVQTNLLINYQAATIMHEIGHNFGLRHGGADEINRKPNYVSVMNYLYSPLGLPTIGNAAEGDRYDLYQKCTLTSVQGLTNAPTGTSAKFVIDYSDGLSGDIDESQILEAEGLGRANSFGVDYNCSKKLESAPYSHDLNADGTLNVLTDNDDWANLNFIFRRSQAGSENGSSITLQNPGTLNDCTTADAVRKTDQPCGQLPGDIY